MPCRVAAFRDVPGFAPSHQEGGILPSEANAVLQLCQKEGVSTIVESGRWKGFSTEIFASNQDPEFDVVSLDYTYQDFYRSVEARLARFRRLTLLYGDAFDVLPYVICHLDRPSALFVDGPKGTDAVDLIRQCFELSPHLKVAFLHDAYKGSNAREAAEKTFKDVWFTDDEEYCRRFSYLDESAEKTYENAGYREAITDKYHFCSALIGKSKLSYGPTLACIWPDRATPVSSIPFGRRVQLTLAYRKGITRPEIRRIYRWL